MKKTVIMILALLILFCPLESEARIVKGYRKKNGTYVKPYYRKNYNKKTYNYVPRGIILKGVK